MPRPTIPKVFTFIGGEDDDTPAAISERSASVVENLYKDRTRWKRRKGIDDIGSGNISGGTAIRGLEWCKLDGTEHLILAHDGDIRDALASTPYAVVGNGTDKLPTAANMDGAVVENLLILGNETDENLRYNGETGTLAAEFSGGLRLQEPGGGSTGIYAGADFTISGWVYFDSLSGEQIVCSIYSSSDSTKRPFLIYKENASTVLKFLCIFDFGVTQGVVTSAVTLSTGTWYHFACRHDGGTGMAISVNGETPVTNGYVGGVTEPTDVPFVVGGRSGDTTSSLSGRVGPLGFWRTPDGGGGALTNGNLTTLYNSGTPLRYLDLPSALTTNLGAWWDMTEESDPREDSKSSFDLSAVSGTVGTDTGPATALAVAVLMVPAVTGTHTIVTDVSGSDTHQGPDTFEYRVSFLNADGVYGEAGPTVSSGLISADFDASVQSIPVCASGFDCGGRRIWRRSGGSVDFKHVIDILDNTTTVYVDTVLNDDLGEVLIDGNTKTPALSCMIEHNSRLMGFNGTELVISNKNEPWYSPESPDLELGDPNLGTRHTIQSRDGTPVGLCEHGSVVAVFTSQKGYFLSGDQPIEFALDEFTSHGCVSHRTIKSAMGLLLWLAPDGVYAWDGRQEARISDDQRTTIDAMTASEMAAAFALVWEGKYFLCWPTGAIVFDLVHRLWTTNTNWLWACGEVSAQSGSAKEKVYAAAYGVARVHQLETGATDNGTTITARWASKDVDMGLPSRDKRVHWFETRWKKGTGTATITLKKGSGQTIQTVTHDISSVEDFNETVSRQIESAVEQARSEFFRLDISIASTASEVELLAAGLEWTPS